MAVPPIPKPQGQERQARAEVQPRQLRGCTEMKDDDDIQDYVRPWRGLTKEEVFALSNTMPYADRFEFAEAIEAKLKEKNRG